MGKKILVPCLDVCVCVVPFFGESLQIQPRGNGRQNPTTVKNSGLLEFLKLTRKRRWTKQTIVFFSSFIFPTQTVSKRDL